MDGGDPSDYVMNVGNSYITALVSSYRKEKASMPDKKAFDELVTSILFRRESADCDFLRQRLLRKDAEKRWRLSKVMRLHPDIAAMQDTREEMSDEESDAEAKK